MLLETIGLVGGLLTGTKLNISNETMIGVGLLSSAITPTLGIPTLLFGLGVGIATVVKNIVKDKYKEKKEELELSVDCNISEEEKHNISCEAAKSSFWCFTSTLGFNTIPLQLMSLIKGLSTLLAPISIITLVIKGWLYITENPKKALKASILTLLVGIIAYICITNLSSGGVFTYFLALISIPSIFFKNKTKETKNNKNSESIYNSDSFLYGGSTNATSVISTAIVLGQTILWGSGKDVLGTLFNTDISVLLDPMRLVILLTIIGFLFILGNTNYIQTMLNKLNTKENSFTNLYKNACSIILKGLSIMYCLFTFNPILVLSLISAGLIINLLDNNNYTRNVCIPLILIIGILSNF